MEVYRNNHGFTLIETLVAVMILAISVVVVLQLFSGGLKASRLSGDYTRAIFHAREKMDELLLLGSLTEGVLEGEFDDGYKWRATIATVEPEEEKTGFSVDTFKIDVDISWSYGSRDKHFAVSTIKIAKKIGQDG